MHLLLVLLFFVNRILIISIVVFIIIIFTITIIIIILILSLATALFGWHFLKVNVRFSHWQLFFFNLGITSF